MDEGLTQFGDIEVTIDQMSQATGAPETWLKKKAAEGKIPARNAGKSSARYWRFKLGDAPTIRAAYVAERPEVEKPTLASLDLRVKFLEEVIERAIMNDEITVPASE